MGPIPPSDDASLASWVIAALVATVGAMATAIVALFNRMGEQQKQVDSLLGETKELMGSVAELVRGSNLLLVEVKDVLAHCRAKNGLEGGK